MTILRSDTIQEVAIGVGHSLLLAATYSRYERSEFRALEDTRKARRPGSKLGTRFMECLCRRFDHIWHQLCNLRTDGRTGSTQVVKGIMGEHSTRLALPAFGLYLRRPIILGEILGLRVEDVFKSAKDRRARLAL